MREGALYATSLTAASRPNPHACLQPRLIRNDSPFSRRCVRSRAGRCVAMRKWRGRRVCRGMPGLLRVCSRSLPSPACPGIGCCVQTARSPSHRGRSRRLSRHAGCGRRACRSTACAYDDRHRATATWTPSYGRRLPIEPRRAAARRTLTAVLPLRFQPALRRRLSLPRGRAAPSRGGSSRSGGRLRSTSATVPRKSPLAEDLRQTRAI